MKTSTERNRERRKWLKENGFAEVRGLYAPEDKHADIKRIVRENWPTPKKRDE